MIVDASVAFKWIAEEEGSAAAYALLGKHILAAPALLLIEIANALWKQAMLDQIDPAVSFEPELAGMSILVSIRDAAPVMPRALGIARALAHPVYDCVYLALAEAEGVSLVTADKRFLNKVAASAWADRIVAL